VEEDWILRKILEYLYIKGLLRGIEESRAFGFGKRFFFQRPFFVIQREGFSGGRFQLPKRGSCSSHSSSPFFSCFDLEPLQNLEIQFLSWFWMRNIPLKELVL